MDLYFAKWQETRDWMFNSHTEMAHTIVDLLEARLSKIAFMLLDNSTVVGKTIAQSGTSYGASKICKLVSGQSMSDFKKVGHVRLRHSVV